MRLAPSPHRACAHWPLHWRDLRRERRGGEGAPERVRDGTLRRPWAERSLTDEEAVSVLRHRVTMDDSETCECLRSERKLKTSCTRVTKTSLRSTRNSSRRRSPLSRISASWPNRCAKRRKWQGLCRREAALHTPSSRARDRDSSRASWPLAKAGRKYLAAVELPDAAQAEDVQRFLSKGFKIGIDGLDRSRRLFPLEAKGQRELGTKTV